MHNAGLFGGAYEPANKLHEYVLLLVILDLANSDISRNLRKWSWFPTIQASLNKFIYKKNSCCVYHQGDKRLSSGGRAVDFYTNPGKYKAEHCGIQVDVALIDYILTEQMA